MCACTPNLASTSRPHIFLIVADDLGWNDFSWRDPTIHSPVLQKLSSDGVVLNQSYVQPVCSPTRGAFMSGYYPFHIGLQHEVTLLMHVMLVFCCFYLIPRLIPILRIYLC